MIEHRDGFGSYGADIPHGNCDINEDAEFLVHEGFLITLITLQLRGLVTS